MMAIDGVAREAEDVYSSEMNINDKEWVKEAIRKSEKSTAEAADREWVKSEISLAIELLRESLRPKGWGRFVNWLRNWGAVGSAATLPLALLALTITAVSYAVSESGKNSEFRGATIERLKNIDSGLLEIKTKLTSASPLDPRSQQAAKEVLAEARRISAVVPVGAIRDAGERFIDAASTESSAWNVALDFISYRSDLNSGELSATQIKEYQPVASNVTPTLMEYGSLEGLPQAKAFNSGRVPLAQAARLEFINKPLTWAGDLGSRTYFLEGATVSLDGMRMRHVKIRDVEVHYSGEPLILEDVIFIHCKFVMDNSPHTRTVGSAMLMSSRLTISVGTS
jgi:hypothetical protein